jgi:quercetin dioxygenase-like cupin family protein
MEIKRNGSQPSNKGPADWFTGTVRIDSPFKGSEPARVSGAIVTFEPGARTAWHTHPLGQTLIVTAGCGRAQREGGPIEEIRPGDIVWFPSPSRSCSMAKRLSGWKRSATNNFWAKQVGRSCCFAKPSLDRECGCGTLPLCRQMFWVENYNPAVNRP